MPTRLENSFDAYDANGVKYRVNVYRDYTIEKMQTGPDFEVPYDLARLVTSCGKALNHEGKGKYSFVSNGEKLTSNDPHAA